MENEVRLWRNVIISATLDARKNICDGKIKDALWHYTWSKTEYCMLVCDYADLDYYCIRTGFEKIYRGLMDGSVDPVNNLMYKVGYAKRATNRIQKRAKSKPPTAGGHTRPVS